MVWLYQQERYKRGVIALLTTRYIWLHLVVIAFPQKFTKKTKSAAQGKYLILLSFTMQWSKWDEKVKRTIFLFDSKNEFSILFFFRSSSFKIRDILVFADKSCTISLKLSNNYNIVLYEKSNTVVIVHRSLENWAFHITWHICRVEKYNRRCT